jgi:hypothetical protein
MRPEHHQWATVEASACHERHEEPKNVSGEVPPESGREVA